MLARGADGTLDGMGAGSADASEDGAAVDDGKPAWCDDFGEFDALSRTRALPPPRKHARQRRRSAPRVPPLGAGGLVEDDSHATQLDSTPHAWAGGGNCEPADLERRVAHNNLPASAAARRHVRGQPSPQGAADAADAAAATTASPPVAAHRMARNCAGATRGEELASLSDDEVHARSKVAARAEPAAPRAKRREKPAAVPKSGAMPLSVLHLSLIHI